MWPQGVAKASSTHSEVGLLLWYLVMCVAWYPGRVSLLKLNSRQKGTFVIKWLPGNLDRLV